MDPQAVDWGFVLAFFATLATVAVATPLCEPGACADFSARPEPFVFPMTRGEGEAGR